MCHGIEIFYAAIAAIAALLLIVIVLVIALCCVCCRLVSIASRFSGVSQFFSVATRRPIIMMNSLMVMHVLIHLGKESLLLMLNQKRPMKRAIQVVNPIVDIDY